MIGRMYKSILRRTAFLFSDEAASVAKASNISCLILDVKTRFANFYVVYIVNTGYVLFLGDSLYRALSREHFLLRHFEE
jgi:hypothetical protein